MRRVIIITIVLLTFAISCILIFHKNILNKLNEMRQCKELEDYYNGISYKKGMLDSNLIKSYEYLHGYVDEELEVSDGIKNFLDCIELAIKSKINNEQIRYDKFYYKGGFGKAIVYGLQDDALKKICDLITNDDIEKYKDHTLLKDIIKRLESNDSIIHKSDNLYDGWFIKNNKNLKIELPYNLYISFVCDKAEYYNNVKRILNIKIYKENKYKLGSVKYIDVNDKVIEKNKMHIYYYGDNKNKISIPDISRLYKHTIELASLTFGQHDYDREREEWSRQEEERARQQMEDEANAVVEEEKIDIPQYCKYTLDARLFVRKHITGKYSVECLLIKRIMESNKPKKIYKRYVLPYEDVKTKEEALERYLSDKEHYDADEEWLKEGNIDYKGD